MDLLYQENIGRGQYEIYVIPRSNYDTAIGKNNLTTLNGGSNLSTSVSKDIFDNLSNVLNQDNIEVLDTYAATGANKHYNMGNVTFPETGSYVVLFYCVGKNTEANNYQLALYNLTMTPVANVAQVGDDKFTDLQSAIAAAEAAKSTAVLLDDVTVDGTLTVSADATLDLAGYTLTAASVSADFDGANIVDRSAKDTGVLKVTDEMKLDEANSELPLYDSTKGGYRFFEATVTSLGKTGTEQNKFWFRVSFTNSDAYALAASQMDIGADLSATEIATVTEAWAGTAFTAKWNTTVANSQPSDICFTAKNFSSLTNFKLTPMVKANGVTVSGAAL